MYSLLLGNSTGQYSRLMVPGLPPLDIPVSQGGYLDGFICFAKSLRQMYLTQNYENLYNIALAITYENLGPRQQLTQYPIGGLAALRLVRSWARVQIVARPTSSKLTVYFVDTGAVQDVDIGNLYELPPRLRNTPPLAIPISMDNGEPEVDFMELLKLRGAKVAVKLDRMRPNNGAFEVSEFTVFERNTNSNLEVMEALRNPEFLARVSRSHQLVQPEVKAEVVVASTTLAATATVATTAVAKSETNWAVLVIAVICVFAFVIVVCVAVFYIIRKIKHKRRTGHQHQQARSVTVGTTTAPLAGTPASSMRATERCLDETRNEPSNVIPLQADGLAVVTAVIALSNVEKDKEMRERNKMVSQIRVEEPRTPRDDPPMRPEEPSILPEEPSTQPDEQSTRPEEQSTRPEEQSTRREEQSTRRHEQSTRRDDQSTRREDMSINRSASYMYEDRLPAAGLSDISTIHSDDSVNFPRCSTPVVPSRFTPLRSIRSSPVQRIPDVVPDDQYADTSEATGYSDILDVQQYVPRNSPDQTGRFSSTSQDRSNAQPSNETMYVTAPWGSSPSIDTQDED